MRIFIIILCMACAAPMLTVAKKKDKKGAKEVAAVKADSVLTDSIAKLQVTIDSLNRERDFFRQYYVKEVKKRLSADRAYMDEPFAHIDTLRLADIARQYTPCPDVPEFAKMTERISVLRGNMKAFAEASALVAADGPDFTPALPAEVDSLLESIKQPLSAKQSEEVDELSGIAGLYADAVEKFQARISDLRATVLTPETCQEASGNAEFAASFQSSGLPGYFDQGAVKNDYRYRISKVPRLKALYDEWQELLSKDFLDEKVTVIEERVLSFGKEEAAEPAPVPTPAPAKEPVPEVEDKADDTAAPAEAPEDAIDNENKDGDKDDEEKEEGEDDGVDEEQDKD